MRTLYLTLSLFLSLNLAAWCNTSDTTVSQPRKAPIPLDLPLSGTVTGNQYQKGSKIVSTQSIESGKTTYLAEEEVVLNEGFEVKEGAEFEVLFDRDSFHIVTMMTYNLWKYSSAKYTEHVKVVKNSKADIVSLQEVLSGNNRFGKLQTMGDGYDGKMYTTIKGNPNYGIGMLWNQNTIGKPIEIHGYPIDVSNSTVDRDGTRGYMVAEFRDFCFVATHFSLDFQYRNQMADTILKNNIIQRCTASGKPVYVAGDMNEHLHEKTALSILEEAEYELLNNNESIKDNNEKYHYADSTRADGAMIDLILEHNTTPYHKTIERGVPIPASQRKQFFENISDHLPYRVRVKVK